MTTYEIHKKTNIGVSAVYYTLKRLQKHRSVAILKREPEGRRRVFYTITSKGRDDVKWQVYRPALTELLTGLKRKIAAILREIESHYELSGRARGFVIADLLASPNEYGRLRKQLSALDRTLEKMVKSLARKKRVLRACLKAVTHQEESETA